MVPKSCPHGTNLVSPRSFTSIRKDSIVASDFRWAFDILWNHLLHIKGPKGFVPPGMSVPRAKSKLEAKGKGKERCVLREYVARPCGCNFLNWNKLPFDVADTLTTTYHDNLACMHHNHSTTLCLTSWQTRANIGLLVPCLRNTKWPSWARFPWATLQPFDWTSLFHLVPVTDGCWMIRKPRMIWNLRCQETKDAYVCLSAREDTSYHQVRACVRMCVCGTSE